MAGEPCYLIGLVESSLETLPPELARTRKARALSRRMGVPPQHILLDKSLFYREMKRHGIDEKRGRPDIVFMFLQATQYSVLNRRGMLRVFVHTINNDVIEVNPKARLPKSYYQFVNLLQHLFWKGRVPPTGEPLLEMKRGVSLEEHISAIGVGRVVLLHEQGSRVDCNWLLQKRFPEYAILVGGFPHGDFSERTHKIADYKVSIGVSEPLDAWIVADRIICCLEQLL
uniref:Ribosomal RNA small subunit methyltransferase Nep1 n=1 Tax=Fervidicoccus fontis TaxID=683846 RepID=A0A7J3ZIY5_9CREN